MSIFEEKNMIKSRKLRKALEKDDGRISGFSDRYYRKERRGLAEEVFGEAGTWITKRDYEDALKGLKKKKRKAGRHKEKWEIEKKIRYLGKFLEKSE